MKNTVKKDARGLRLKKGDAVCFVNSVYRKGGYMLTGIVVDLSGRYVKIKLDNSNGTCLDKMPSSLYKLSGGKIVND